MFRSSSNLNRYAVILSHYPMIILSGYPCLFGFDPAILLQLLRFFDVVSLGAEAKSL